MSKKVGTVRHIGNAQYVSKVLQSQLMKDAKVDVHRWNYENYRDAKDNDCYVEMAAKLQRDFHSHTRKVYAWESRDFRFTFEYGRKGSVRVTYMNSEGIASAVFSKDQMRSYLDFIAPKAHDIRMGCIQKYEANAQADERKAKDDHIRRIVRETILEEERSRSTASEVSPKRSTGTGIVLSKEAKEYFDKAPSMSMEELEK
jgi:hypothetical protein